MNNFIKLFKRKQIASSNFLIFLNKLKININKNIDEYFLQNSNRNIQVQIINELQIIYIQNIYMNYYIGILVIKFIIERKLI